MKCLGLLILSAICAYGQFVFPPAGGGGGAGVSSVGLTLPSSIFSVSGSPVTSSGTLTGAFAIGQTANRIFGTDSSGNVGLMALTTAQVPSQPYDIPFSLAGLPTANFDYPWFSWARVVTFPANFSGAVCTVSANPTATATWTIKQTRSGSTTSIGTVVVATNGTCTYTTTGGTTLTTQVGDRWTMTSPTSQDATLAGFSVTLTGSR